MMGAFFLPKGVMAAKGILTPSGCKTRMCMYPPHIKPSRADLREVQRWQLEYYASNLSEFREIAKKTGFLNIYPIP